MNVLRRIREWRIDRMTDRIARRPHGRHARAVYGANDVHEFAWDPVLDGLRLRPADRLLDVGCGGGVFLRRARETGCEAVGLDHSRAMVRLARRRSGVEVFRGKAEALPFPDESFDAVASIVAFFFFPDQLRVLREMRRVLDPRDGRIAIYTTSPEARGTMAAPYPLATRGNFRTDEELEALARDAGFPHVRVTRPDELGWAQLLVAQL